MPHTPANMSCATTQLPKLSFFCPNVKFHGIIGLSKHYNLWIDPNLGHGKCAIRLIPCEFIAYTTMLDKPWAYVIYPTKQHLYQPAVECTHYPVWGSFNNWNTIQFTNKTTSSEDFDEVHKVLLDCISDNMASFVQLGKCGAINAAYTITMGYYVIKVISEPYTLQEDQTTNGQVINTVEILVKAEYLSIIKAKEN